jgi:hypothetical protein
MELFRVGHDVYGQRVLEGISWSLVPYAVGVVVVVIVGHQIWRLVGGHGKGDGKSNSKRGA